MQRGNILIFILVGILVLAGVAGGAYYLGTKKQDTLSDVVSRQNPVFFPNTSPQQDNKPTPNTTPQLDETANWKTFSSTYFGFSNKYPADWENDNFCYQCPAQPVIEQSNERYFHSKQDKYPRGITYMIDNRKGSASLEVIENTVRNWNLKNKGIEDITVDGNKGIKVSGFDENGQEVGVAVFENKNYIFQVSNHQGYSNILKQILSTFKFL